MASAVVVAIAGVAGWVRGRGRSRVEIVATEHPPVVAAEAEAPAAEQSAVVSHLDDRDGDLTVMMRRQG